MPSHVSASAVPAQDLIAMIAHDLRTPVTAIKGFGQLALRQNSASPQVAQYLKTVIGEANRMASMVDDLVLVSNVAQGVVEPQPTSIDAVAFLESLAAACTSPEFPVAVASAREPVSVQADALLLGRAFANLIRLALKYCRNGGSVGLGVQGSAREPIIWVATHPEHRVSPEVETDLTIGSYHPRGMSTYIATLLIEAQGGSLQTEPLSPGIRYLVRLPAAP